jgi:plastocyanin
MLYHSAHNKAATVIVLAALVLVILMAGIGRVRANETPSNAPAKNGTAAVAIKGYAFKASEVKICAGNAVEWKNDDEDPHTVTAADGSFDSKSLGQGDKFRHVFQASGRFAYYCAVHPFMKGAVVVSRCSS